MTSREAILAAVRAAKGVATDLPQTSSAYRRSGNMPRDAMVRRFLDRLADYDVHVTELERESEIAETVATRLGGLGAQRLATPADLPPDWRPAGPEVLDASQLAPEALDAMSASLTGCACAVAETGTVVLDGGPIQGRRVLTLLPDHHLCVVFADQLVETVPEALQRLAPAVRERRPLTFFSGPSATADIEFDRVVGVHGPRQLDIIFIRTRL